MIDTSLAAYRQDLAIKGFSPKTQKTYFACDRKFVAASGKSPAALAKDDVTGVDLSRCPACGQGRLTETLLPPGNGGRAPPGEASA